MIRRPELPRDTQPRSRVAFATVPIPQSESSAREGTPIEDDEYPDDEAYLDATYGDTVEPYVTSAHNDGYHGADFMDPLVDDDDYLDFFANPDSYLGTITDDDVERRVAMVHIETTCIEGPFDGQVQSQMKGKIPENKIPVLAQASLPTDPANKPRASTTIQQVQRDIDRCPHQAYLIVNKTPIHCDGGANSHITTSLDTLLWYRKVKSNVTMANGTKSPAEGYGCQLVRFPRDNRVYALWPVYYMPNNEWPTLSTTPALRVYNGFRRASVHALESLEITTRVVGT